MVKCQRCNCIIPSNQLHGVCEHCLKWIVKFYLKEIEEKTNKYEKGFEIMYEFFDSIADEQKEEVSKQLDKLGL